MDTGKHQKAQKRNLWERTEEPSQRKRISVQEVSKKGLKSEPNGTQDSTKGDPEGHNDALWTPESIKRHERRVCGSEKKNPDGPRGVFGDEKEENIGPRGVQKGVQIRAHKENENRALAAARTQSSLSEDKQIEVQNQVVRHAS